MIVLIETDYHTSENESGLLMQNQSRLEKYFTLWKDTTDSFPLACSQPDILGPLTTKESTRKLAAIISIQSQY